MESDQEEVYLGAIDQGTTSTRFIIFDSSGKHIASHQEEFKQYYPRSGWHEQDPLEILSTVKRCMSKAISAFASATTQTETQTETEIETGGERSRQRRRRPAAAAATASAPRIRAVGITNQRETTIVWDRLTGNPLHRAIAWPDTRTASLVRELRRSRGEQQVEALRTITGLPLSTYPSAVKLVWLLRNVPEVRRAYDEKRLAFGTVDTWLMYKLARRGEGRTRRKGGGGGGGGEGEGGGGERPIAEAAGGASEDHGQEDGGRANRNEDDDGGGGGGGIDHTDDKVFVTDATNASRTMLADLSTLAYSDSALAFFGLDREKIALPRIVPSADDGSGSTFGVLRGSGSDSDGDATAAAAANSGDGSEIPSLLSGTPITGCLGDQSAALVGHCGFEPGAAKNTYGTGCFLLYNVGRELVISRHGLLATVAYHFPSHASPTCEGESGQSASSKVKADGSRGKSLGPEGEANSAAEGKTEREGEEKGEGKSLRVQIAGQIDNEVSPVYALEGSIAVAGSAVKFLVDNLSLAASSAEVSALAASVPDAGGCVFVTAFSGLFAPYWVDDARGTLFGVTGHTTRAHVARAALEATCFQTRAILEAMRRDSGHALAELAVDGGMSNSDVTMQAQADLVGIPVVRPAMRETTALGAAVAAGLGIGVWPDIKMAKVALLRQDEQGEGGADDKGGGSGRTVFEPHMDRRKRDEHFALWEKAVAMCTGWVAEEEKEEEREKEEEEEGGTKR